MIEPGEPLPAVTKTLDQGKINRYAEVSGDGNPLHTDPEFASRTPFGGTIAHGLLVLAYLSESLTLAFGRAWLEGGKLKVRFRAPARPGDTVTAGGTVTEVREGLARCQVEVRNQKGEALILGEAEVLIPLERGYG